MTEQDDRGRAIRQRLASMPQRPPRPSISTGFACLDRALGVGGWPRGEIVELFGPSSVGKTSLLLQSIAHAQSQGRAAAWIDADRSFDAGYAAGLGVLLDRLPVAQPQSAEEAIGVAVHLALSGALDLIALDSAAALVPELELSAGIGETGAGLAGRVLSSGLRRLSTALRRSDACVIFLNQSRARRDSAGQEVETSAGGSALKLYSGVRISFAASGRRVRFRVLKNKAAEAFGQGELQWKPGAGFMEAL
jgi:recombination protein RecA